MVIMIDTQLNAEGYYTQILHRGNTIETKIVKIEPVEVYGPISSYVISYINELEQESEFKGFSLVKVGDHEIIQQFKLLASFGLQAYFDNDRSTVQSWGCGQFKVDPL